MGTHQNAIQAAIICLIAVMGTLLNGAFNALVCVAVHHISLLFLGDKKSISQFLLNMRL